MSVRLHWNPAGREDGGAFVVHNTDLYLVRNPGEALDRLNQDPGDRPGLVARNDSTGHIELEGRGGLGFLIDGKVRDRTRLAFGHDLLAVFEDSQWTLTAEGQAESRDPLEDTDLGGYRILERLDHGSVGVVYRALQVNLDREVAVKVLDPKAVKASPLAVASFKREAVAAGRLSHPNLVQVYDVGHDRGLHFFAMELIRGTDLEHRLQENGAMDWETVLPFLAEVVTALEFAETHRLVHRDIKPDNLLLTADGRIKLADLGMAATRGMLQEGQGGGTPHFMAPEAVAGGKVDQRSDFYSLGCTLFRLLTGETPFQGDSVKEILRAHRDDPIPSLKAYGASVPGSVQALLESLMAKDPADRPQSAADLREAMEGTQGGSSRQLPWSGLAVAAAVLGVGAWYFLGGDDAPEEPVIVEVESEQAKAERLALEAKLAFVEAMALSSGSERMEALQDFLIDHAESELRLDALDELERLANLPEADLEEVPVLTEEERQAALQELRMQKEVEALTELWRPEVDALRFGKAESILSASALPAERVEPLWQQMADLSAVQISSWEQEHATALEQEDWAGAELVRRKMSAAFTQATRSRALWETLVNRQEEAAQVRRREVLERDFQAARRAVQDGMRTRVLPAVLRLDFDTAGTALQELADACPHPALSQALTSRIELFAQAQTAATELLALLNSGEAPPITEPVGGKRAFAERADEEGIHYLVQIQGQREKRSSPWQLFLHPEVFPGFLKQVFGEAEPVSGQAAMQLLVAEAWLSQEIATGKGTAPSITHARSLAALLAQWLQAESEAGTQASSSHAEEVAALEDMFGFLEALAAEDPYRASGFGEDLMQHFSLLSVWLSDGSSSWGLQP